MAIALTCSECERDMKVKDELAGRKIKCPECGSVLTVPSGAKKASAVVAGAPARAPKLERDLEEDRPRKKKKKKKSNKGLIIALSMAGLLLLGGGVVLVIVLTGGGDDASKQQAGLEKKQELPRPPDGFQPPVQPPKPPATGIRRAGERAEVNNAMRQLGLAYHMYCDAFRKGPQKWEDLAPYYEKNPQITEMLTTKYITFLYGTHLTQMIQGTSNTVLAYETQLDQQGIRIVLMGDGSVSFMNDAELKAAPKAGQK